MVTATGNSTSMDDQEAHTELRGNLHTEKFH